MAKKILLIKNLHYIFNSMIIIFIL